MKQAIICALVCVCALSGCIQRDSTGKSADLYTGTETATETETARAEGSSSGESSVGSTCEMRQWDWDIEKYDWEEYGEYTVVFGPDDLTPQEILCDNVFSSCQDGRENATIQELYRGLGEQWEHLWYTEYDFNNDGKQDYIVLYDCPDQEEGVDLGSGDVWIAGGEWRQIQLPRTTYLTGGTWEDPQLEMMLLAHEFGYWYDIPSIAVYVDYGKLEMVFYGWDGGYRRIRAVTVAEEISGVEVTQTEFSLAGSEEDTVRLQLVSKGGGRHLYQVFLIRGVRHHLEEGMSNCTVWDGNDDGYEDILYYAGFDGGSGGTWDFYYLLCWSEKEQRYECVELPMCCIIDQEKHKLYSWGQCGVPEPWYEIYGLRDGEYRLEKELYFRFELGETEDTVTYSEYGEVVEELDITDMRDRQWKEMLDYLKEKYPDFSWVKEYY